MRYARILSKLYAQPLLLQPSAWHAFDHALRDVMDTGRIQLPKMPIARIHDDNPDLDGSDDDCPPSCAPARMFRGVLELRRLAPDLSQSFNAEVELPNDTAIIHFDGVLDKHISMMDMMCYGGVDLDDIDAALAYVAADANIRNVLLVFNSPGGSVIGVPETAARVEALSRAKNVITFSDSVCCSGAVYIGSQASEFYVTASTYSGSIGVIRPPILDFSEALKEQKITATIIKSGKFKDTGSMLRPITDEEKTMLQAQSDRIMGMFTTAVKSGRPKMSADAMQGQVFFGTEAVEVGLADAVVADLNEALAAF
jgi:signal peptide peptidase SppA